MKYYQGLVPFIRERSGWEKDAEGNNKMTWKGDYNMANYTNSDAPYSPSIEYNVKWVENKPFSARMRISDYERGRSSVNFIVVDQDDLKYYITLKEMFGLMKDMTYGQIGNTEWVYAKKGSSYSIIPYKGV